MARVTKLTQAEADACREMLTEGVAAFKRVIARVSEDAGVGPIERDMVGDRIDTVLTVIERRISDQTQKDF